MRAAASVRWFRGPPSPYLTNKHAHPSLRAGDAVKTGQPLLILEAMKMENVIKAAGDGVVEKIAVAEGDVIEDGREVVVLKAGAAA